MLSKIKLNLLLLFTAAIFLTSAQAQSVKNTSVKESAKNTQSDNSPGLESESAMRESRRERTTIVFTNSPSRSADAVAASVEKNATSPVSSGGKLQFGDESGWELYLAGGGSLWSSQNTAINLNQVFTLTPNQPLPTDQLRVRQSFVTGGRFEVGVAKNITKRSAVEIAYGYGTNNFRLAATENGAGTFSGVRNGDSVSLGMRSHMAIINYRYSLVDNENARFYLTGGFNLTGFTPNNDGLDRLLGLTANDLAQFKERPNFRRVIAPGANFGAGFVVKANESFGFRFDVRDYMTFTRRVKGSAELNTGEKVSLNLFGNTIHNVVPTFGIVFSSK